MLLLYMNQEGVWKIHQTEFPLRRTFLDALIDIGHPEVKNLFRANDLLILRVRILTPAILLKTLIRQKTHLDMKPRIILQLILCLDKLQRNEDSPIDTNLCTHQLVFLKSMLTLYLHIPELPGKNSHQSGIQN